MATTHLLPLVRFVQWKENTRKGRARLDGPRIMVSERDDHVAGLHTVPRGTAGIESRCVCLDDPEGDRHAEVYRH
jgi:hypothetical protein